jgi:hypothetical protein
MTDSSRRGFLALAGVGAAAGAAAVALPSTAAGAATPTEDTSLPSNAAKSMVVYVDDITTGKATLMIDGAEVVVTDKVLVSRIARAFARAHQA